MKGGWSEPQGQGFTACEDEKKDQLEVKQQL